MFWRFLPILGYANLLMLFSGFWQGSLCRLIPLSRLNKNLSSMGLIGIISPNMLILRNNLKQNSNITIFFNFLIDKWKIFVLRKQQLNKNTYEK